MGHSQPMKRHPLQRRSKENGQLPTTTEDKQLIATTDKTLATVSYKGLTLMGKLQEGQASCLTEETVMAFLDIPVETFEIGAILHHGT